MEERENWIQINLDLVLTLVSSCVQGLLYGQGRVDVQDTESWQRSDFLASCDKILLPLRKSIVQVWVGRAPFVRAIDARTILSTKIAW